MNRLVAVIFLALSAAAFAQSEQVETTQVETDYSYNAEVRVEESHREGQRRWPGRGDRDRRPRPPRPPRPPAPREMSADSFWQLQQAIAQLPAAQRQTFVLHAEAELSYREVADVLGISIGTVMSRLFYARQKLRALLEPWMRSP